MKAVNNVILRIVFTLVLGVVLIFRSSIAVEYLVITIGVLFLISGLVSVFRYLLQNKQVSKERFPLESIGSVLLGIALILVPGFFISALMYILAGVLILAGIFQIRELFIVRKYSQIQIPFAFYIPPVIVLLIGIVILFNPFTIIATTFMILGIACVIYSLSELINYLKFLRRSSLKDKE